MLSVDEAGVELVLRRGQLLEQRLGQEAVGGQVDPALHVEGPWTWPLVELESQVHLVLDQLPVVDGGQGNQARLAFHVVPT